MTTLRNQARALRDWGWRHLPLHFHGSGLKLHLACGPFVLDGWINLDWRHNKPGIIPIDLRHGLKRFESGSAAFVYMCGALEHFDLPDAEAILRQIRRILQPGGVARFMVPDMEKHYRAFVARDEDFWANQAKMHPAFCLTPGDHIAQAMHQFGGGANDRHRWGYDFESLAARLRLCGFSEVRRSTFNGSEFPDLRIDYRPDADLSLYVDALNGVPSAEHLAEGRSRDRPGTRGACGELAIAPMPARCPPAGRATAVEPHRTGSFRAGTGALYGSPGRKSRRRPLTVTTSRRVLPIR
jgi:predicted SAM-dependent methyltransferase